MHIYRPTDWQAGQKRTAIVIFFGGGWTRGSFEQQEPRAKHFANKGLVAIYVDCRVKDRNGTMPLDAIDDGRSAMAYIAEHAQELGIDAQRVVASGESSGGHIAASMATLPPMKMMPAALVLFAPSVDTPKNPAVTASLIGCELDASPVHRIKNGIAPAILFHGTADTIAPIAEAEAFCVAVRGVGSRCEVVRYEGQTHGFSVYARSGGETGTADADTNARAEEFLRSLHLMQ